MKMRRFRVHVHPGKRGYQRTVEASSPLRAVMKTVQIEEKDPWPTYRPGQILEIWVKSTRGARWIAYWTQNGVTVSKGLTPEPADDVRIWYFVQDFQKRRKRLPRIPEVRRALILNNEEILHAIRHSEIIRLVADDSLFTPLHRHSISSRPLSWWP